MREVKERQIIIDCVDDISDNDIDCFTDKIDKWIKEKRYEKQLVDVYWDDL